MLGRQSLIFFDALNFADILAHTVCFNIIWHRRACDVFASFFPVRRCRSPRSMLSTARRWSTTKTSSILSTRTPIALQRCRMALWRYARRVLTLSSEPKEKSRSWGPWSWGFAATMEALWLVELSPTVKVFHGERRKESMPLITLALLRRYFQLLTSSFSIFIALSQSLSRNLNVFLGFHDSTWSWWARQWRLCSFRRNFANGPPQWHQDWWLGHQ